MPKALKTAAVIAYNVLIVCALLALAEYAARLYVARTSGRSGEQADMVFDRWAAARTTANFHRRGVSQNAQGFRRARDISVEKPPNTVRIFLMGASTAYGAEGVYPEIDGRWTIDNRQTIDYFLEQRLAAAFPARHWEVINAAVKGFLLHQDLSRLLSVVLRYRPDCVLSLDGMNDMSEFAATGGLPDPYGQTGYAAEFSDLTDPHSFRGLRYMLMTWLDRNSVLARALHDRLSHRAQRSYRASRAAHRTALSADDERMLDGMSGRLGYYRREVRQMHRILDLDGVEDVFLLQPTLRVSSKPLAGREPQLAEYDRAVAGPFELRVFQKYYPELARELAADAPVSGYEFLDLSNVFDGVHEQTFTDYCHLTPAGNRILAERIFHFLSQSHSFLAHLRSN